MLPDATGNDMAAAAKKLGACGLQRSFATLTAIAAGNRNMRCKLGAPAAAPDPTKV